MSKKTQQITAAVFVILLTASSSALAREVQIRNPVSEGEAAVPANMQPEPAEEIQTAITPSDVAPDEGAKAEKDLLHQKYEDLSQEMFDAEADKHHFNRKRFVEELRSEAEEFRQKLQLVSDEEEKAAMEEEFRKSRVEKIETFLKSEKPAEPPVNS